MPKRSQIEHARQMVAGYTPQDAAVRELLDVRHDEFIEAVACLTLTTRNYATTALGLAVRYALYLEGLGLWSRDSDDPVPFTHRWVTKFAEQRLADGMLGAETSQSLLSGIGRVYQPALWPRPTHTLRTRNPKAPYPPAEQATFRTVASQWRAVYDDARIEATVSAGFGAGLAPADFRVVRGHHVHRDADGLVHVTVEGSTLIDRTVPVLPEWADLLAVAAAAMGEQLLISGLHDDNRNHTERITVPLRKFAGLTLSFRQMRATWLVGRLAAGVPERVVRRYAGLNDSATFSFFDTHFDAWDDDLQQAWIQHGGRPC